MNLKHPFFLILMILISIRTFGFQSNGNKYLIIKTAISDSKYQVGYDIAKAQDSLNKDAYILNIRYRLSNLQSSIGSDADFIFVFYIFPKAGGLKLVELPQSDSILNQKVDDISAVKNLLVNINGSIDEFNFTPLISHLGKLYRFADADIFGQAFNLKESIQYFPEYKPLVSNRYELNMLHKPYTKTDIAVLQKKMKTDTSGLRHFDYDGFDGKWNIKSINKSEKTIDFWIRLIPVATGTYSFGRFADEIKFKLNTGVVGFKVEPLRPIFDEQHLVKYHGKSVSFVFKKFIDLESIID